LGQKQILRPSQKVLAVRFPAVVDSLLAGLKDPDHAAAGPLGGAIFETAVLLQIVKAFVNRGEEPRIYFWRTSVGS
jgi:hypothetical protein